MRLSSGPLPAVATGAALTVATLLVPGAAWAGANDACALTGKYWVFYSAATNVGLKVTVTDTQTGRSATYVNPDRSAAPPVQDTSALPCG